MKKRLIAIGAVILVAAAAAGGYAWYRGHQVTAPTELTLYGNVDIRQVSLAFDASGRISEMNVDEGQVVEPGQVLAKLDTRTLELQAKQAAAQTACFPLLPEEKRIHPPCSHSDFGQVTK